MSMYVLQILFTLECFFFLFLWCKAIIIYSCRTNWKRCLNRLNVQSDNKYFRSGGGRRGMFWMTLVGEVGVTGLSNSLKDCFCRNNPINVFIEKL